VRVGVYESSQLASSTLVLLSDLTKELSPNELLVAAKVLGEKQAPNGSPVDLGELPIYADLCKLTHRFSIPSNATRSAIVAPLDPKRCQLRGPRIPAYRPP
jgi:hypothetical protein